MSKKKTLEELEKLYKEEQKRQRERAKKIKQEKQKQEEQYDHDVVSAIKELCSLQGHDYSGYLDFLNREIERRKVPTADTL